MRRSRKPEKNNAGLLEKLEVIETHLHDMIIVLESFGSIFGVYNGKHLQPGRDQD